MATEWDLPGERVLTRQQQQQPPQGPSTSLFPSGLWTK